MRFREWARLRAGLWAAGCLSDWSVPQLCRNRGRAWPRWRTFVPAPSRMNSARFGGLFLAALTGNPNGLVVRMNTARLSDLLLRRARHPQCASNHRLGARLI